MIDHHHLKMHTSLLAFFVSIVTINPPPIDSTSVDLHGWSKLVEVPTDHHPLEYPSLDSPIKDHERVHDLPFLRKESPLHPPFNRKKGSNANLKRERSELSKPLAGNAPTRKAHLKSIIANGSARQEHYAELAKIRSRERFYRQNYRAKKKRRLADIMGV